MKLYIKNYSSYKSDIDNIEIKKELKQKYKLDTRRQDDFIHLAVFGAQKLKEKTQINRDDELYITSGVGNIDVLQKTNLYVCREKQFIKLFDFINMLGNTTSYYVASSLGVKGKNIFQISDNFTFINSLISIYASINISKKDAILGSIDFVNKSDEVIKRVLGISKDTKVVSGVNYQKFSLLAENAIATLEFDTKVYNKEEIILALLDANETVLYSMRCKELEADKETSFFETMASYALNSAIKSNKNLIYVDCFEDKYKILKLKSLT